MAPSGAKQAHRIEARSLDSGASSRAAARLRAAGAGEQRLRRLPPLDGQLEAECAEELHDRLDLRVSPARQCAVETLAAHTSSARKSGHPAFGHRHITQRLQQNGRLAVFQRCVEIRDDVLLRLQIVEPLYADAFMLASDALANTTWLALCRRSASIFRPRRAARRRSFPLVRSTLTPCLRVYAARTSPH